MTDLIGGGMAPLTITWKLWSHGWAFLKVADDHSASEVLASYVTDGPEQFLYAIARLATGERYARADLEGEPQIYRWFFHQDGPDVDIRLLVADDDQAPESSGTVLWAGCHPISVLARSAVRAFDQVAHDVGEEGYASQWGRPFPRPELEALRTAMRTHIKDAETLNRPS
ncbi:hypothetical protein [Streptomyces sp. NPDC055189]